MKTLSSIILRNSLLFFATLFTISSLPVTAQTKPAAAAATKPVARITQAIDESNLVTLGRSVYPAARPEFDQGLVADSQPMNHLLLVLQRSPQQETALRSLLDQQQAKGSANYHAWLTPATFGQQFGVADADVQTVTGWLTQKGFTDVKAIPGSMFIEFSGTAGTVRTAFHTEIHNYLVKGQMHFANASNPQIPAALAPVVARIHSMHNFRKRSFSRLVKPPTLAAASGTTRPGFTAAPCTPFGAPTCFAVGPGDLATIYNIPATVAGSPAGQGQTIAIVARSNITISDITQFGSAFGIPSLANFSTNNVIVNGPDPGIVLGDDEEATLDLDMVGSTAPNANILLVVNGGTETGSLDGSGGDGTDGVDQSALYIITNNLAPVMTESFGSCEQNADTLFSSTLWEQGAAQGISIFVSTGDSGSDSCDDGFTVATSEGNDFNDQTLTVSGDASTPFNIAVGGTDFNDASDLTTFWNATSGLSTAKSYIPEIPWNDSCAAAATTGSLTVCANVQPDAGGADLAGGSGGQSSCGVQNFTNDTCAGYPKPSWQTGAGVPADSVRDIPDVSLFSAAGSLSGHFYVFCLADSGTQNPGPCNLTGQPIVNGVPSFNFSGVGGTSASTPAWAGIMALVNQSETAAGRGGRQGNANYVLYKLLAAQATSPGNAACNATGATAPEGTCTFNDITIGNNSVECAAGALDCSNTGATGFGVLTEPGAPFPANTPAWMATAGYDLATGIGTPNVGNLILNWGTVITSFKTATPAITSPSTNTVNITHGNNQSFTITVSGAGGTPSGDVSLIAEPPGFGQVGAGFGTLKNGTVTITTNMLPGDDTTGAGTAYPVIAHYAGDGTFGPADSQPINVTVNRESSTTTATLYSENISSGALTAATSVQYGTSYIMIVNVVGATAGFICGNTPSTATSITEIPTVPCPTGKITLKNNGQNLNDFVQTGAANVNTSTVGNLGFAEDLLIQLSGGSNAIVASYSGDNSYNASTSTNPAFTVTTAPTQTVVTLNGAATASVPSGGTVALVATVNTNFIEDGFATASNGAGPTGTVTFTSCGTAASCTVPLVPTAFNSTTGAGAFATAALNTSFNPGQSASINAAYSGDTNYAVQTAQTPLALTVAGTVGAATKLAFVSTLPSSTPVGVAIAPPVQVAVEDVNGNIVTSATNSIAIAPGPGTATLGGTLTVAAVKGIATFSNLTVSAAGTGDTLIASSGTLSAATSAAFNVTIPAAKLAFTTQPSSTNTGASIVPAVAVTIEDANGNVVTGATNTVTIAIGANPGGGTLGGVLTASPVSGIATFSNLTISAAGNGYTLTAAATGGLTGSTSAAFNIASTPTQLKFIAQPSNTVASKSISPAVQVAIEDVNGSVVAGATTPITIAIGTNPAAGTLGGTATVTPVLGIATFSNLSIGAAGNGYTLTASATALTQVTSAAFNVTAPLNPIFTVTYPPQPTVLASSTGTAVGTTITVTPSGGFTGPVLVTAGTLPSGVTCPNSPVTITVTAGAVTGSLSCQVATTSSSLSASNARLDDMLDAKTTPTPVALGGNGWWALSASTGFAALFLIFLPGGRKRFRAALGLGLACLLSFSLGCSNNGSPVVTKTNTATKMTVIADKEPSTTAFTFAVTVTGGTPTGMVQLFDGATAIGTPAAVTAGTATPTAPALSVGTHSISAHYLGDSTTNTSASGSLNLTSTGSATITIITAPAATPVASPLNITIN
ncbi:MAG TPA: Ig-like domain repeat protein [Candidatus Acidoferrum sp.]|nr:Ig-like domain repeat protein [Candidatus Acidoferrum sp.]